MDSLFQPQISYLTLLDMYAIVSIFMLVVLCVWHSLIATFNFLDPISKSPLVPSDRYVLIDRYVFVALFTMYIGLNIALVVWLYTVPYKRRREMDYLDRQYASRKYIQLDTTLSRCESRFDMLSRRPSGNADLLNSIKSYRTVGSPDGVVIVPNGSTVIPIQEEPHITSENDMDDIEERDDDYYGQTSDTNDDFRSRPITPME